MEPVVQIISNVLVLLFTLANFILLIIITIKIFSDHSTKQSKAKKADSLEGGGSEKGDEP